MHKRVIVFIVLCSFVVGTSVDAASLSSTLKNLIQSNALPVDNQAVCIEQGDKELFSTNRNMRVIPASVSKLYTFDWVLSSRDMNSRYTTTFILKGTTLYINGSGDSAFVGEHLAQVLQKIKTDKKVTVTTISFSPNFFFNWQGTPVAIKNALATYLRANPSLGVTKNVVIKNTTSYFTGSGTTYRFDSMPLSALVKLTNNYSTNIVADTLFAELGGAPAFSDYMYKTYGVTSDTIVFNTGSGLYGNYTTCALTLNVIKHLQATLESKGMTITDVLSMPAVDPGVLINRKINTTFQNAIVAKSGFINYHHTLAGVINTKNDLTYFGIFTTFLTMEKSPAVKSMVDTYTESILTSLQSKLSSFSYAPRPEIFLDTKVR